MLDVLNWTRDFGKESQVLGFRENPRAAIYSSMTLQSMGINTSMENFIAYFQGDKLNEIGLASPTSFMLKNAPRASCTEPSRSQEINCQSFTPRCVA